ncbi:hypothetical protein SPRG_11927 [Saprolegnia parasitica CBS 223.65]|uniref:Uncharacterized protein n=1 Tax=Saprolegnia parasitica (strain CBS 223.65) TaxID=695850 RepID=A0A067BXT4_SAPPC|nr:hypothetical protein SPRG_11927 [Saprolegnia parasitica CBS 223.65]KDO23083.1 hypothetical protein SPRG_11927 [Saprolegnia parasitica CBS 223.65]|eukprot:XP_012206195.1 hypothetical protein SPRG_11927 [Saprolegnia parasitica CBS 223.65]
MADDARAQRRARILASQEKRLKYVTGQTGSLAPAKDPAHDTLDEMAKELENEAAATKELVMPSVRVDPAQRRRDAALRKAKQQEKVAERLGNVEKEKEPEAPATPATTTPATTAVQAPPAPPRSADTAKSNYSRDVTMFKMEQTGALLVILIAAIVVGLTLDLEGLSASVLSNPQYAAVQALLAQGIPIESVKQQLERDQMDATILDHIQASLARGDSIAPASSSWFLPSFSHPPLMLFPVAIRLLFSVLFKVARSIVGVPVTGDHEADDSGMIMKMVLGQVPMLRDILRMGKKLFDDVCVLVVLVCVTAALRVVVLSA